MINNRIICIFLFLLAFPLMLARADSEKMKEIVELSEMDATQLFYINDSFEYILENDVLLSDKKYDIVIKYMIKDELYILYFFCKYLPAETKNIDLNNIKLFSKTVAFVYDSKNNKRLDVTVIE